MIRFVVLSLLLTGQAQALSCLRPSVEHSFQSADQSADTYYILRGRLDFDADLMPEGYDENPQDLSPIPADFTGWALTPSGFTADFTAVINLHPTCSGPWCGVLHPSSDAVIFARETPAGLVLEIGPCPWLVFDAPTREMEETLIDCLNGRACEPETL